MFWGEADIGSLETILLTVLATLALVVLRPTESERSVEAEREWPTPLPMGDVARAREPRAWPWPTRVTPLRRMRRIPKIRPRRRRAA